MKGKMGRMLLLAIAVLLGSGSAVAFGTKGNGMDHKEKGAMTDEDAMKRHDETMKEETKKDEMKEDEGMMKKDHGKNGGTMEKKDAMKDTMK